MSHMWVLLLLLSLSSSASGDQMALNSAFSQPKEACSRLTFQYLSRPSRVLLLAEDLELNVTLVDTGLSLQIGVQKSILSLFSAQNWALAELSLFGNSTLTLCQEGICIYTTISQENHTNQSFALGKDVKTELEDCSQSLLTQTSQVEISLTNNLRFDYPLTAGISVSYGLLPGGSYPDIRRFDPIPSKDRGVFIDLNYSGIIRLKGVDNLLGGSGLTIEMWVFYRFLGNLFSLDYLLNDQIQPLVVLTIASTNIYKEGELALRIRTNSPTSNFIRTGYIFKPYEQWVHVGVSLRLGETQTSGVIFANSFWMSLPVLGPVFRPPTSTLLSFGFQYAGFIYQASVAFYEKSTAQVEAGRGVCTGCYCPSGLNRCISTCHFGEYTLDSGDCGACLASCKYGCVRPTDCSLCADPLCYQCTTFDAGSCVRCVTGASFQAGICTCDPGLMFAAGECKENCGNGYYQSGNICIACEFGCERCDSQGCSMCQFGLLLYQGACTCGPGMYIDSVSNCKQCIPTCLNCKSSASICTQCYTSNGYVLLNSTCQDCRNITGYYDATGVISQSNSLTLREALNQVCKEICGDGRTLGQLECDDGNTQDGDGCSHDCRVEEGWKCWEPVFEGVSICKDLTAPSAVLVYMGKTQEGVQANFTFTEIVVFEGDLDSLIEVQIERISLFSWSFTAIRNSSYILSISAHESIKSGTLLTLQITTPALIKDTNGNSLPNSTFATIITDDFTLSSSIVAERTAYGAGAGLALAASSSFLTSALAGTSLSFLWGLIEALQLINYLSFMSVSFPDNLKAFLRALNFANFAFLPGFVDNIEEFESPPEPFEAQKWSSGFIANSNNIITLWIAVLGGFLLVWLLKSLFPVFSWLRKLFQLFTYSIFLRCALETCLQLCLTISLQLRTPIPTQITGYLSLLMAIFALIGLILLHFTLISQVTCKSYQVVESERHRERLETLYEGLKVRSQVTRSFTLFQTGRKALFTVSLVYLSPFPLPQALFLLALNGVLTLILAIIRPYKAKLTGNVFWCASELLLTLVLGLISVLTQGLSFDQRNRLGWAVIALLISLISLHFTLLIYVQYQAFKQLIAKVNSRYRPQSSDRIQSLIEAERGYKVAPELKDVELEEVTTQPAALEQTFQQAEAASSGRPGFRRSAWEQ